MGNILSSGNSNSPEKLFGVKVNSSDLGKPVTVILGTLKTNQKIFWIDGFTATQQSTSKKGGGGKGGGKGNGEYLYSADVIAGLCAGPISGIGDVWSGQSWLGSPTASEAYTIAGPSCTYTPINSSSLINNYGVSATSNYTGTYTDYSAPGSTLVGNTTYAPFTQVAYGTALTTGTYSIDPATGIYHFSLADVGTVVTVAYSYLLTTINQQETDLIPSGRTISVGGSYAFNADLGVTYGGTGTNSGDAFTRVGTPSAAGEYSVSGSAPATYHFASADIGAEVIITFQIANPNAVGQNESTMLDFTLAEGYIGQTPFSFLSGSYPGAALGYSGVALLLYEPMDFGMGGEPQENSFEVITPDIYGGVYANGKPIMDCSPVHCMIRVLTDKQWGLGVGAQPFPESFLDNGTDGTWGVPGTPSVQSVGATAWNWFAANNFFISPELDSQDSAASTMSKWLEAGMCAAFVSEGLLKLVPYGDTTTAANGCTWTAPSSYVVALDDTCFLAKDGTDPVSIKRSAWQDAYNEVQVQWDNRANQYAKEITAESDQSLINRYGSRIEDPQDWGFIHNLPAATFAANMRLKHGTYIRNTYEFSLPFTYSYLEPMDLVTITTSSVWAQGVNNTNLGVTSLPIRITKIVDDPIEGLKIEAEDYPFGAGQPTIYNKGLSSAQVVSDPMASPGTSEVVLFEATGRLTGYAGNQIWIGACGTGENYGETNVWVSQDNVNYVQVTTLNSPAVLGQLAAIFPAGSDPDTSHNLVVQLAENSGALSSGTTTAADNDTMLCFVDNEVVSYSAAATTGQNTYTMSGYIRRGQLGTTINSHAVGSLFMRLDGSVFKYTYDPTWEGKTVYFKFQAVNNFGNNPQPLSNLSAVTFVVGTGNTATIDASTGLVSQNSVTGLTSTITTINTGITTLGTTVSTIQTATTAANSVNYLTNADKIALMAQYAAELATKTSLDSLAASLSVSSSYYDAAVAAISTTLVNAGAPSNWATIWPDGTTSGPWSGIQADLSNLWAAVATQRATLQGSISDAQAAAAQAAAISAAATDATSKMNTALALVPANVDTLPTLPSASYPAGMLVFLTTNSQLYTVNTAGTTWVSPTAVNSLALGGTAAASITPIASLMPSEAGADVTGSNTAAAIAGQGALATQDSVALATQVTGQLSYTNNATAILSAINSSGNVLNLGGTAASSITPIATLMPAEAGANVTETRTAAGIAGQGALATVSSITSSNSSTLIGAGAIQATHVAANAITAANLTVMDFTNLCYNPGFELGTAQWSGDIGSPILSTAQAHTGTISAKLSGGTWAMYNQNKVPCAPGQTFLCQCYAMTDATLSSGCFGIRIQYFDASGVNLGGDTVDENLYPTTSWAPYTITVTVPSGAYFISCGYVSLSPTGGNVYLDDFSFRRCNDASLIVDGSITAGKIAANCITADQIAANTITAGQIAANTITAGQIAANAIGAAEIAANCITAGQIAGDTITADQIAAGAITADLIQGNCITADQIAVGTITADQIATGTITADQIATGTITADQIATGTITADQIATGTITADQIASNTITAGQIAAGAIGATQIAANSITAANLTVMDFTNLCYNPGFELGTAQWSGDIGSPILSTAQAHTGTISAKLNTGTWAMYNQNKVPCAPGQTFLCQCYAMTDAILSSGCFSIRIQYFDASGVNLGGDTVDKNLYPTTSWAPYTSTVTVPSGAYFISCGYVSWSPTGGNVYLDDFYFRRCNDASLIVDGSITATKIAAGAITADMITTGTLNAADVTVTNLNASNITTGTLSAAKVLFADGSALTTASRVLTSLATLSANTIGNGYMTALGELGFTTVAASSNDTYNVFLSVPAFNDNPTVTAPLSLYVVVDYNTSSPHAAWVVMPVNPATYFNFNFVDSITGLSSGTHTIQIYFSGPAYWTIQGGGSNPATVLMQRIY